MKNIGIFNNWKFEYYVSINLWPYTTPCWRIQFFQLNKLAIVLEHKSTVLIMYYAFQYIELELCKNQNEGKLAICNLYVYTYLITRLLLQAREEDARNIA